MSEKTGCFGNILKAIVGLVIIGAVVNIFTCGGGGSNKIYWKGNNAYIKVDDYYFDENSDPEWWSLCDKIIKAAEKDKTEEIRMELVVTWVDKYGEETKEIFYPRMDDPKVRPISEIRKYQSGKDLFDAMGYGFVAEYILAKR